MMTTKRSLCFYKIINIVCYQNIKDQLLTNSKIRKCFSKSSHSTTHSDKRSNGIYIFRQSPAHQHLYAVPLAEVAQNVNFAENRQGNSAKVRPLLVCGADNNGN